MENVLTSPPPWHADGVLAVLFTQPGTEQPDALSLWSELIGTTPDAFHRDTTSPALMSSASGILGSKSLQITSQIGRIDVALGGDPSASEEDEHLQIVDVAAAVEELKALIRHLSKLVSPVRAAIVADCSRPVDETDMAAELSKISGASFPDGALDLVFQFNVRKKIECHETLLMNRLKTWNAGQQAMVRVFNSVPKLTVKFVVGLKVDINMTTSTPLSSEETCKIFDEMGAEALSMLSIDRLI